VKDDPRQAGLLERSIEAAPQLPGAQVGADLAAEDEVFVAGEVLAALELRQAVGDLRDHRDAPDPLALRDLLGPIGVVVPDVDQVAEEVDIRPAQPDQLALAQSGERRGHVEGGVLLVGGMRGIGQADGRCVPLVRVERAAARIGEDGLQRLLGHALGVVAGRRSALAGPRGTE